VPVTSPEREPVNPREVVADAAFPFNVAVITFAVKLPEASRNTMALGTLAIVAVVAELATLPALVIVANLSSVIAAEELISLFTISDVLKVPDASLCTTPAVLN